MSAAADVLKRLRALGARIESDGDRLILRAGKRPIPEPLVEEVRTAREGLLGLLAPKALTSRHSVEDEHLRHQTGLKAAENLVPTKALMGEHLREHLREGDEHLRQDPQKSSVPGENSSPTAAKAPTKAITKALMGEHLRRGEDLCGFGAPETPKVLISQGTSVCEHLRAGGEHLGKTTPAATVGSTLMCCECGTAIAEPVVTWWGGRPCHRGCGEAAWRRELTGRNIQFSERSEK
jgi:hypothetical protein